MDLTEYINDGSLASMCAALAGVIGSEPFLRDAAGRVIPTTPEGLVDRDDRREGAVAVREDSFIAPITVASDDGRQRIGSICLPESTADSLANRAAAERAVELLALLVGESCSRQLTLRGRVADLDFLSTLSSRLATTHDLEALLDVTLDAAMQAGEGKAGSIRLLDEDTGELRVWVSRCLSDRFCEKTRVMLRDSAHDREALDAGFCCVREIAEDATFVGCARCREEGLAACLIAGLSYQGRDLGTIRLYSDQRWEFTDHQRNLLAAVTRLSSAAIAHAGLVKEQRQAREVQRQVRLAADVQHRMLPQAAPACDALDIEARYIPCRELAGDFYDVFEIGGNIGFVIGDVVGKGAAAALLMASVRATIRAHAQNIYNIDEIVDRTNRALVRDTLANEFVTLFYGVIDPVSLRLTYVNAGHDWPIIVQPRPGRAVSADDLVELTTGGIPVGIDASESYECGIIHLEPGDVVLCYTDGLAEAVNFDDEWFGKHRIRQAVLDVLNDDRQASAERVLTHALWEMRRFAGLAARPDDVTLLAIRVR
ncbi:MAG: SpoIIE family protein phosphatase [Phycisphaerales bacterium]|nr:SpoIIE family protein phosphatase [Phycisphaerales bacterium]